MERERTRARKSSNSPPALPPPSPRPRHTALVPRSQCQQRKCRRETSLIWPINQRDSPFPKGPTCEHVISARAAERRYTEPPCRYLSRVLARSNVIEPTRVHRYSFARAVLRFSSALTAANSLSLRLRRDRIYNENYPYPRGNRELFYRLLFPSCKTNRVYGDLSLPSRWPHSIEPRYTPQKEGCGVVEFFVYEEKKTTVGL